MSRPHLSDAVGFAYFPNDLKVLKVLKVPNVPNVLNDFKGLFSDLLNSALLSSEVVTYDSVGVSAPILRDLVGIYRRPRYIYCGIGVII